MRCSTISTRRNRLRLCTNYRQPIDWTIGGLREAQKTLDHWYALTADAQPGYLCADTVDALLDDLNTPKSLAALHELPPADRLDDRRFARGAEDFGSLV